MILRQFFDTETSTYTYLLADEKSRKAALIDPVIEQLDRDLQTLSELGLEVSATAVASHYEGIVSGFVLDEADADCVDEISVPCAVTGTLMEDLEDKRRLAREVLALAAELESRRK